MRRLAFVFGVFLAGCGGQVNYTRIAPSPTATPTSTPAPPPAPTPTATAATGVQAAPATVAFSAIGQNQTITVTDPGYAGAFVVSGCSGTVTTSNGPGSSTLLVTAAGPGSCTLTVADANGSTASIAITVTTLNVPVE